MNRDKNGRFVKRVVEKVEGLPEKWCINRRNYPEVQKWFNENGAIRGNSFDNMYSGWMTYYPAANDKSHTNPFRRDGYVEITIEQFRKYILKQEEEFKLPQKWCIKLSTREINDAVNSIKLWRLDKLDWCDTDSYTNHYIGVDGRYSKTLPAQGYTPISFEQFKKYVLKEKEFILPKEWCLQVTEDNKSTLGSWRTHGQIFGSGGFILSQGHHLTPGCARSTLCGFWVAAKPINTPEITFEQFKKYVLKQDDTFPEKWCIQKKYQEVADWLNTVHPKGCYDMAGRCEAWAHSLPKDGFFLEDTVREGYTKITIEQFRKHVLKQEIKMYTLKELFEPEILIFLKTHEQHSQLKAAIKGLITDEHYLCDFHGEHCYSIYNGSFSSTSTRTNTGGYAGTRIIITFDQINFNKEENMEKKLAGYKLIKEYPTADDRFKLGFIVFSTRFGENGWGNMHETCEKYPEFWKPVYEDEVPKVEIRGYKANFEASNMVKFGCKTFTKREVLDFVRILDESGLKLESFNNEVQAVAQYFKNQK